MNWMVVWIRSAKLRLAELWIAAADRAEVTRAADAIDAMLRKDPLNVGESRQGERRVLIEPPLAVYYDVSIPDRRVFVRAVWRSN